MDKEMRDLIEAQTESVAKALGGGWVWNMDVSTNIVLTLLEAKALMARLGDRKESEEKFTDPTEELHYHLTRGERHASKAMDVCYRLEDPAKRNFWFRRALGNAQNILMTLLVRDIKKQHKR